MSEITRQDLISDEALQAPLLMAQNLEQVVKVLKDVYSTGKQASAAIGNTSSINKLKSEIENLAKAEDELDKIQTKVAASAKTVAKSNNEVAEYYAKANKESKAYGTVVNENDKANAKAANSATAYGKAVEQAAKESKKAEAQYKAEAGSLGELIQKREALKVRMEQLKSDQKEDTELKKQGILTQAEYTQRMIESETAMTNVSTRMKENNEAIKTHTALQGKDSKEVNASNSSLKVLEAALAKNRAAYAKLSDEQKRNSKEGKELLKIIQEQDKQSKSLSKSIGITNKEVGSYKDSIIAALSPLTQFTGGMGGLVVGSGAVSQGLKGGAKSANIFSIALRAIPLIAIITAISSLLAYFKGTEEGAQRLRIIMAGLGQIFASIKDVLIDMGKALYEAFENPQQLLEDLGNAIKENVMNRIYGTIELFMALKDAGIAGLKILKEYLTGGQFTVDGQKRIEEMKEQLKDSGKAALEAMVKAGTGIDKIGEKIENAGRAFGKFVEDTTAKVNRAVELQKLENALLESKREFLVYEAKTQKEINEARERSADTMLVEEERLANVLKAQTLMDALEEKRLAKAQKALYIAKERAKLSHTDETTLMEIAELEAEIYNIQSQRALQQRRLTAQIASLQTAILKRDLEAGKQRIKERENEARRAADAMIEQKQREVDAEIALVRHAVMTGTMTRRRANQELKNINRAAAEDLIEQNIYAIQKMLQDSIDYETEKIRLAQESGLKEAEIALMVSEIREKSTEEQIALEKKLHELKMKLQEVQFNNTTNLFEYEIELLEDIKEVYEEWAGALMNLFASIADSRIAEIDRASRHDQMRRDELLAQYEGDKQRTDEINEEFERREAQREKKRIAAMRKAAIFEKAAALTQAGIMTGLAVLTQLGSPPAITAIPRSILAGILGGIQIAAIAAKPIPKYAEGTDFHKGGKAIIGEVGKELVVEAGRAWLSPDRSTVVDLKRGAQVIPHDQTMQMIALNGLRYQQRHDVTDKLGGKLDTINNTIRNKKEVIVEGRVAGYKNGGTRVNYINSLRNR